MASIFSCYNYFVEHISKKSNCIIDLLTKEYIVNKYDVNKESLEQASQDQVSKLSRSK